VIEEVTSTARLEALAPEWWALWHRCSEATPFQSPAWLLPWWRRFGTADLFALAMRRDGRLTSLVPLYGQREHGAVKLLPLGIGVTDYLDPLLAPSDAAAVLAHLASRLQRFDRVDLVEQRAGSPLLDLAAPGGWQCQRRSGEPCPTLTLSAADPLTHSVPRLAKQPYYQRRAERLGPAAWVPADHGTLPDLLQALVDLHAARWSGRGQPGVLAEPQVQAFHREATAELLRAGLLRMFGLQVGGRLVAVFYGLADRRCFYAYLSGYDPTLPHPGLGAMLIGHAIASAAAGGRREFHFLRGRESYKYAWGAVDRPLLGLSLWK
jgi:CelD/BcsL family acetyltransferase involved in cellulose biosynthesis